MASSVVVYEMEHHNRSRIVCGAMLEGLATHGETFRRVFEHEYTGIEADVAVFYGLSGKLWKIYKEYSEHATALYIDLGYWGRREGGRWTGYHKIVKNSRHPTSYFQNRQHASDRADALGVRISPWQSLREWPIDQRPLLLAGMGDKGAEFEGYDTEEWERWAIERIRKRTKRQIIYRPKPSWKNARPLSGCGYSSRKIGIEEALSGCYAVVTHHSNVAVDALVRGIPVFSWDGVATKMGSQDLDELSQPRMPEGREQWVYDLAYTQYSIAEMKSGRAWQYVKEELL